MRTVLLIVGLRVNGEKDRPDGGIMLRNFLVMDDVTLVTNALLEITID